MMKSRLSTKIIIGLVLLVAFMTVGYAAFGQILNINGKGTLDYNWSVHFDQAFTTTGTTTITQVDPVITNDTITFNTKFAKPGETKTYVFKVVNDGTIDAVLKSTVLAKGATNATGIDFNYSIGKTSGATDIQALVTDSVAVINNGSIAKTTGTQFISVTISYNAITPPTPTDPKEATFDLKLNYEQA
ncbi:MAG: hypothetical protein RR847_00735 [Bacilli bacterium]